MKSEPSPVSSPPPPSNSHASVGARVSAVAAAAQRSSPRTNAQKQQHALPHRRELGRNCRADGGVDAGPGQHHGVYQPPRVLDITVVVQHPCERPAPVPAPGADHVALVPAEVVLESSHDDLHALGVNNRPQGIRLEIPGQYARRRRRRRRRRRSRSSSSSSRRSS